MASAPATIGVDLGATALRAAVLDPEGEPRALVFPASGAELPAAVAWPRTGGPPLVGLDAERHLVVSGRHGLERTGRLAGLRADAPELATLVPPGGPSVVAGDGGEARFLVGPTPVSGAEATAHLLAALRDAAERASGGLVDAVVTLPATAGEGARRGLLAAAALAGLEVRRLVTAGAAAAVGARSLVGSARRIAVCDAGASGLEVTIAELEGEVVEVRGTARDEAAGGDALDRRVLVGLADVLRAEHGFDPLADPATAGRLRAEARRLRHVLSVETSAMAQVPAIPVAGGRAVNLLRTIRRPELESWLAPATGGIEAACLAACAAAGIPPSALGAVVLTGGLRVMPLVRHRIEVALGLAGSGRAGPPLLDAPGIVGAGATRLAAVLAGRARGPLVLETTGHTVGLRGGEGRFVPVFPRGTSVPARDHRVVATTRAGQRELVLDLLEGEHALAGENRALARLVVGELPSLPAGEALVWVDFTTTLDGLVEVEAFELASRRPLVVRRLPPVVAAPSPRSSSGPGPAPAPA